MVKMTLPTDSNERKDVPMWGGLLRYFPAALAAVARISLKGDRKHNPENTGLPFHARGKSTDHDDCVIRHTLDKTDLLAAIERNEYADTEEKAALIDAMLEEAACRAWRSLADYQELAERFGRAPIAPGAKLPERQALFVSSDLDTGDTGDRRWPLVPLSGGSCCPGIVAHAPSVLSGELTLEVSEEEARSLRAMNERLQLDKMI